jgi:hypothetical protein
MAKTFTSYNALTDFIMDEIAARVEGSDIGISSRSVSRYVELGERRVRISDHDATASCGGGVVYEIDIRELNAEEIEDEFGDFDGIEIYHDWKIGEWVDAAVAALVG